MGILTFAFADTLLRLQDSDGVAGQGGGTDGRRTGTGRGRAGEDGAGTGAAIGTGDGNGGGLTQGTNRKPRAPVPERPKSKDEGARGGSRTHCLRFTRPVLWPNELLGRNTLMAVATSLI